MGYRLTKIYTRTGDDGSTHLGDGKRIPKNHRRLDLLGTIDELNSAIGLTLAHQPTTESIRQTLHSIQHELFNLGGELCPPYQQAIGPEKVSYLEKSIDDWNKELPPLKEFILPGGNLPAASCHLARTICRRVERAAIALHHEEPLNPDILRYLNRLSDLLFVCARMLARETDSHEVLWQHH